MAVAVNFAEPLAVSVPKSLRKIPHAAEAALHGSAYPDLRRVQCHLEEGVLVLSGRVSSYFMKQMAQSILTRLSLTERLANRLEVKH